MMEGFAALILLTTLSLTQTAEVPQQMSLAMAEVGADLNLTCRVSTAELILFFWYKVKFGYMIQNVAKGAGLVGQFNNPRFKIIRNGDLYTLTIGNVSKEDEATYYCQSGEPYMVPSFQGTILVVNDHKNLEKQVYVKQSPESESVDVGHSVTLECSLLSTDKENAVQCPGEHNVHWFKNGSGGSNPGVLYTSSSRRNEREEKTCIYSLSKTIQNSADTGNYYCAVVTCGRILFGEGTKVDTKLSPVVIVPWTLMSCCVLVIAALILCRKRKPVCAHCKGDITASNRVCDVRSSEDQPNYGDGDAVEVNYAALDFTSRKAKRWKNNRDLPQDCIYSGMRDDQ
uniref:uncharacterized protein LOC122778627 n=1 Tax=Solea senegalensis TaxID=28829 RepID=UPI001CD901D9|nr:uncharacterized protein LOC122778627 [Solea senegalensis]